MRGVLGQRDDAHCTPSHQPAVLQLAPPVSLPVQPCMLAWLPGASSLLALHLRPAIWADEPRAAENNLTGTIPEDLMELSALTYLRLERNKLSGPIPASLAAMSELVAIRLVSPCVVQRSGLPCPCEVRHPVPVTGTLWRQAAH